MFRTLDRYEDCSLGLPYPVVLLNGAEEEIDDDTGARIGISIPHLEDLIATVAITRALHPMQLDGAEVKFIRRVIGKTAKDLAANLGMAPETYSRWETGKQAVGEWADRQVRLAAIVLLLEKAARLSADTKAVVGLRIQPKRPGETPHLEIRFVKHAEPSGHGLDDEWDMPVAT